MYYTNEEHFRSLNGYDIDDAWFPRVTKIVEIKAKPALYRFYGEMESFSHGEKVAKASAEEGTLIHETVEKILVGENPEIFPSISPAVNEFLKFFERSNILVDRQFVEKRVISRDHRYAGTIDALALINGKFGVLDIKTSQAIYRDYDLQTAAYLGALEKELPLQTRWILRLDQFKICLNCDASLRSKGGRDKIRKPKIKNSNNHQTCDHQWSELKGEVELKEFPYWRDDFKAFLNAKALWEWENDYWLKKIGYF